MEAFSPAYKRYALLVMTAVYMLNLVDRGLVIMLLQPIKEDLLLSDTQLGLVTGIAFGLFYAVLGVPIARWADVGNRVTITALAIGLWSATVMSCLFVSSYIQLVFARVAAAVGEAGCKPPTYSLVGDYFPEPSERTAAMSVYISAGSIATLVSFAAAGWLNDLYGWRMTFFLMGIPGLVLALIVRLTVVEPRGSAKGGVKQDLPSPSLSSVLATLWTRRSCRHLTIAQILLLTMSAGLGPWYAAFMVRAHGMDTRELGVWMGIVFGCSGIAGLWLGGYIISRWFAGNERGQMRMSAVTVALYVPFFFAFLTLPQKYHALSALIPMTVVSCFFMAPIYTLMQRLVPDEMRATALAIVMLLGNLIGMGVGPLVVGVLSDVLTPIVGGRALGYAMMVMSLVAVWAAYHFWKVAGTVSEDLAAAVARPGRTASDRTYGGVLRVAPSK